MSETTLVRVTKKTAELLNELVRKLNPGVARPGAGNLADKLLAEAIDAIEQGTSMLTVRRLHAQLRVQKNTYDDPQNQSARAAEMPKEIAELRTSDPERFATIEARLANIESLLKAAAQPAKKKHS